MLYRSPEQAGRALNRPVVAIGNFDGVHRGHAAVIERAVSEARSRGVDAAVLTFEPHPVLVFRPETPEFRLTSLHQKAELLSELGIDAVIAAPFNREIASLSPEAFVQQMLIADLDASAILVGSDFRFGKGRAGDTETLRELGAGTFEVLTLDQIRATGGEVISSTRIRAALGEAELALVERLLGRPYAVRGRVVHGDALGRTFGFPTANIAPETPLLPPDGIYAGRLQSELGDFVAATYIGTRPTVGGTERVVEAYCLDVDGELDLYDHVVSVDFFARVRGDRAFASQEELVAQMHVDIEAVRAVASER